LCNSQKNFDEFFQNVCENYGASSMKVNATRKRAFDAFSEKVKEKSAGVTEPRSLVFYSEKNGSNFLKSEICLLMNTTNLSLNAADKTFNFPKISLNPQKVVILVDKYTLGTAVILGLELNKVAKRL
jgi:hypothetical protein